jgi:3-hydroxyisobutyrate dehydrogenase-like beta-hydroxyacid dehydrogenase
MAGDANEAASNADLIISAVTAAQDIEAARALDRGIQPAAFFLDLNSVSPSVKQQVAQVTEAAGARYVEAAIMSPISPKRIASPMLLGGAHAAAFLPLAQELGLSGAKVFSDRVGPASAAKMCRSVVIKGVEALLAESLLTARHYGVESTVIDSLQNLLPASNWRALARYMISRSLTHGRRRAEEMREVARTVAEAGIEPHMSAASALRQEWAAGFVAAASVEELEAMLDSVLALSTSEKLQC